MRKVGIGGVASLVAFPSFLKSIHWLLNHNQKIKMVQDLQDRHLAHNIIMRWSVFSSSVTACQHHVPSMWERHITSQVFFLLLLLSHFSRVRLCATAQTAAHQAPLSLGFSRQEHWSRLPFPSPVHESEKWKWSRSVVSDSWWPHGLQPTRLLCPWDFPGKSTGVGCHCLLRVFFLGVHKSNIIIELLKPK